TASIAPGGDSIWPGDPARQIAQTMDVIAAILRSRGLGFADVTRASAYFKRVQDLPHFERWLGSHGFGSMPYLPMHCDVCRDDLLFELELDACR
ncbi:MAG TPA: endoribonuclease L-PSP, partial [Rariglobus sp.]